MALVVHPKVSEAAVVGYTTSMGQGIMQGKLDA